MICCTCGNNTFKIKRLCIESFQIDNDGELCHEEDDLIDDLTGHICTRCGKEYDLDGNILIEVPPKPILEIFIIITQTPEGISSDIKTSFEKVIEYIQEDLKGEEEYIPDTDIKGMMQFNPDIGEWGFYWDEEREYIIQKPNLQILEQLRRNINA